PISDEAGWFASTDYAAFTNAWNQPGWGFGFVAPGTAFGELGYRGDGDVAEVYAAVQLDGITLGAGKRLALEQLRVWRGGLQEWAAEAHRRDRVSAGFGGRAVDDQRGPTAGARASGLDPASRRWPPGRHFSRRGRRPERPGPVPRPRPPRSSGVHLGHLPAPQ